MLDDNEWQCILNLAPAESKKPSGIFRYQYSEELAYLGIFLGRERPGLKERLMKVQYGDIYKSELGRSERRPAMNVENIFDRAKKNSDENSFREITDYS